MYDQEETLERLQAWNPDEIYYRGYYEADRAHALDAFLKTTVPADPVRLSHVQDPKNIHLEMTEEMFFNSERNVTLIKHPRYLPVFDHKHRFFEILYVLTGGCRQLFSDRTCELKAGDCCLIAPGIHHAVSVFDGSVVLNILIRKTTFLDIFLNAVRSQSQLSLFFLGSLYEKKKTPYLLYRTGEDPSLRSYILEMVREQAFLDEYSDRIICSLLTIFFHQLTRRYGSAVETPRERGKDSDQAEAIMDYIMNHYAEVSIKSLAEHFHFSEPYCSKLVKEASGSTFSDLLTSIRMRRSENLLVHTQLSVEEISSQVGYKNPESYIRCFKRIYQVSPSQFRRDPERVHV